SMASRGTSPATSPDSNRTSSVIPTIGMRGSSWAPSGIFRAAPRARPTSSFGSTIPSASRISPFRPFCTPRIRSKSDPSPSHWAGEKLVLTELEGRFREACFYCAPWNDVASERSLSPPCEGGQYCSARDLMAIFNFFIIIDLQKGTVDARIVRSRYYRKHLWIVTCYY